MEEKRGKANAGDLINLNLYGKQRKQFLFFVGLRPTPVKLLYSCLYLPSPFHADYHVCLLWLFSSTQPLLHTFPFPSLPYSPFSNFLSLHRIFSFPFSSISFSSFHLADHYITLRPWLHTFIFPSHIPFPFILFHFYQLDDQKMKCFFFKDKCKSAPELQTQNNKKNNPRTNNSTGSVSSTKSVKDLYREKEKEHSFRVFTFQELRDATNGFNRMLKIGEGGFGSVYKGSILPPNGQGPPIVVAIKKLNTRGFQVFTHYFSSQFFF